MAQVIPAPNPAANNAPGPVTLPATVLEQRAAILYVESLLFDIRVAGNAAVTVDHLLAGIEYMYGVLCGRAGHPVERVELLPQYIGAPVYAQMIMASVLKKIEAYNTLYRGHINGLERTLLKSRVQAAKTFNRLAGDGHLYPYEQVPFLDGQLPSDLGHPPLLNVASMQALTRQQMSDYLGGWGLARDGDNPAMLKRVKAATGCRA
ncbi:hypothetical protein EV714DRAFT_220928 [Schizophyllum commune]